MSTVTIKAPVPGFTGTVAGVSFADGSASVDPKEHPGAYQYFQDAGYEVDGEVVNDNPPGIHDPRPEPTAPAPGTPDNPTGIIGGVPPKDAAVDKDADGPMSDAFLPPTNAGEADPHGPLVVSPGLHAVPPAPIRPGEVHVGDEVAQQELEETRLAEKVLVEGQPATIIASNEPPGGPLQLSDPGSVERGIEDAAAAVKAGTTVTSKELNPKFDPGERTDAPATAAVVSDELPSKSARKAEWVAYAMSQGMTEDEANELTIAQLVEKYSGS